MKDMNLASWFMLAIVLVVSVSDFFFATNLKKGDTYSETIMWYIVRHPILSFSAGIIIGHLIWPQYVVMEP